MENKEIEERLDILENRVTDLIKILSDGFRELSKND